MSWKKSLVLLVVLSLVVTAGLAGCGKKEGAPAGDLAAEQKLTYNLGTEPETLDPAKMTGIPEFTTLTQFMEGLTRMGPKGPEPGMAKEWKISTDGLNYTFTLRDGIKWSNGDPVTAQDFEFAWKRALDPATAADYAYQMYYLKNGQAYNEGKATAADVGVKAKDAKTLEVTLEAPTPYFLGLTSFQTYMPVNQKWYEANKDKAFTAPDTLLANGPFKVATWEHNSKIEFVPNESYWDAKNVKLKKLVFTMVEESSTELTMFETGEIDYGDNPPTAEIPRLKSEGKLQVAPLLGTYYYIFNVEKKPLDDPKVRKALALAIDRNAIVTNVTKGGQIPALAFVPGGIPDAEPGSDFRKNGGDYYKDADIETAKKLLAEAGYPDGKGLPPIEILYNTSEGHKAIAEAIQEMWKKNLGIENITLTNQEWKVYLQTRDEGTFQIARAGWIGDYLDPMTFIDMWTTGNGNNNSRWGDPKYDALIEESKKTTGAERSKKMHQAEDMLMDAMPIMPIYYYVDLYVVKPYVKDFFRSALGPVDFKTAWIEKH